MFQHSLLLMKFHWNNCNMLIKNLLQRLAQYTCSNIQLREEEVYIFSRFANLCFFGILNYSE